MPRVNLPVTLGPAFWDKQKGALAKTKGPPATKLADELKALAKLHTGIDWTEFEADKLTKVEDAKDRLAALEAAAKGAIKSLTDRATAVGSEAKKFQDAADEKDKLLKEPLAAAAAVEQGARDYASEVEKCIVSSRKELAAKVAALVAAAQKDAKTGGAAKSGAESPAAKLVRSRALDAIRKAKKPKPGASPTRFVIVQGKTMVATYLGPSIGPTQEKLLKSLIGTDGPYRVFKDAHGQVLWEKNALTLVSDTLPTGLAKKMQLWLKPILKLNLKLRVRKTTGEAEESEGEDIADNLLKRDEADSAQSAQAGEELKERFSALEPAIKQALGGPLAADVKELLGRLQRERAGGDFDEADAVLDEVESVLERGEALDAWQAECEQAVTSLKSVASAIASARHASSAKGVVEIQQVLEKLKTAPTTAQLVAELQTFVADDVVVADVSELATDIRTPMLRALAELRAHMGG